MFKGHSEKDNSRITKKVTPPLSHLLGIVSLGSLTDREGEREREPQNHLKRLNYTSINKPLDSLFGHLTSGVYLCNKWQHFCSSIFSMHTHT